MTILQSIIIGVIQGITEFLPISSSAHIRIAGALMGIPDPGARYTAIIQLGTELAIVIYFWPYLVKFVKEAWLCIIGRDGKGIKARFGENNIYAQMFWNIIISAIPIGVLGILANHFIEKYFRNLWIIVFTLAFFGIILGLVDFFVPQKKNTSQLTWKGALGYGFGQAAALIPGVSRSGGSITVGRAMGYSRLAAARISFLISIPAVSAAAFFELISSSSHSQPFPGWAPTLISTVLAGIIGYCVMGVFLRWISKISYMWFAGYRVALALFILILLVTKVLSPLG